MYWNCHQDQTFTSSPKSNIHFKGLTPILFINPAADISRVYENKQMAVVMRAMNLSVVPHPM